MQSSVIDFNGDGLINFELGATTGRSGENLLASNKGVINAGGGHVTLTAQGAMSLFNAVVENTGSINATSLSAQGGIVTLKSNLGSIKDSGTIEASGATGGGDVLVWASENTDFTGDIKAEALANANNIKSDGGKVEVSGIKHLKYTGTVSTLSHNGGNTGSLLLDPTDIEIVNLVAINKTTISADGDNSFIGDGTKNLSYIRVSDLQTALASNNVIVDATATGDGTGTGKITVSNDIAWTGGGNLTLKAGAGGIFINANISSTALNRENRKAIILNSAGVITQNDTTLLRGLTLSGSASGDVTLFGNFDSVGTFTVNNNKNFSLTSTGSFLNLTGAINAVGGGVTLKSGTSQGLTISGTVTADTVNLISGDAINCSPLASDGSYLTTGAIGKITATTLTGSAVNAVELITNITNLGAFSSNTNPTRNETQEFILTNDGNLTITGEVSNPYSYITLNVGYTNFGTKTVGGVTVTDPKASVAAKITTTGTGRITAVRLLGSATDDVNIHTNIDYLGIYKNVTIGGKLTTIVKKFNLTNGKSFTIKNDKSLTSQSTFNTNSLSDISYETTSGNIYFDKGITVKDVVLKTAAGGTINSGDSSITAHDVTIDSGSTVNITQLQVSGRISGKAAGEVKLSIYNQPTNAQSSPTLGDFTLSGNGDFTVNGYVNLNVDGGVTRINNAVGRTSYVVGSPSQVNLPLSLTFTNNIDFGNSNLSVKSTGDIIINKNISTTGSITLTIANIVIGSLTTLGNGGIAIDGQLTGNGITLTSLKGITGGGLITGSSLALTSNDSLSLTNLAISGALSGTGAGAVTLAGSFDLGSFTQTASGAFSITNARSMAVDFAPRSALTVTGAMSFAVTGKGNTLTLTGDMDYGSENVSFASDEALVLGHNVTTTGNVTLKSTNGAISLNNKISGTIVTLNSGAGLSGGQKILATTLRGSAAGNVTLTSSAANLDEFTVTNSNNSHYSFALTTDNALTIKGAVSNIGGSVTLTTLAGGISSAAPPMGSNVSAGSIKADSLVLASVSSVNLTNLTMTGAISGTAGGAVSLSGNFASIGSFTQTANGNFTITDAHSLTVVAPTRASGITGDISYSVTGTGNALSLSSDMDFGATNLSFSSQGDLIIGKNVTTTGNINLTSTAARVGSEKLITANNLTVNSAAAMFLNNLAITGTLTGSAGGAATLGGTIATLGAFTQSGDGEFAFTNMRDFQVTAAPIRTNNAVGDISYTVTGASTTLTL
ncbi:MAG: hypothetical protein ORN98_06845, partial [Alphaproteobacteria bacterium]|nr:hypothetical protein [Alphaproteobacteria bacterium]